jgi:Lysyl oxidase
MRQMGTRRVGLLLAGVLPLGGLGLVGVGAASAAPGYRLAFASTVDNGASAGPLIIKGHRLGTADPMMADQLIELSDGSQMTRPNMGQLIYEEYPDSLSHRHWHYKAFVRYQLRATSAGLPIVRPDNKAGFCLSDPMYAPDFCGSLKPEALSVSEGLGPDTTDYYNPNLEGQYIDITDVPPGEYWIVHWVNSGKEICESDYANNAAAVKIALWPNGYGATPYFTLKGAVEPFPPLFTDLDPPLDCGQGTTPAPKWPDLKQRQPSELSVTVIGANPGQGSPGSGQPGGSSTGSAPTPVAPTLTEGLARRYVVKALTRRFHRRPRRLRVACRKTSRTSSRCAVSWRQRRYQYVGSVRIFTVRTGTGFERRFDLRVRRTDKRCSRKGHSCSRMFKSENVQFR